MYNLLSHKYALLIDQDSGHPQEKTRPSKRRYAFFLLKLLGFVVLTLPVHYLLWLHGIRAPTLDCRLPTDILLGEVPWRRVILENDPAFIDSDPFLWGPNKTSPWVDNYPGTWIVVDNPSAGGIAGMGMRMTEVAAEPASWTEASEGFGIAVMHQLHCVMTVKHAILGFERGDAPGPHNHHLHHCVETLRQAVMCHGDLALERPHTANGTQTVSGWGNVHMCRDWPSILQAILKRRIIRTDHGWEDASKR